MKRPLLAVGLAAALVVTAYLAIQLTGAGGPEGRRDRDAGVVEEPETERSRPLAGGGATDAEEVARAAAEWRVTGFVRDEAGRPVAGARVRARPRLRMPGEQAAVTDANGAYALAVRVPAVVMEVYAKGYLPIIGLENGLSNGRQDLMFEGEGPWRRDFVLKTAASLGGRVLDESLNPVPHGLVYVISPEHVLLDRAHGGNVTSVDENGWFLFQGLPPGRVDLGVKAEGYLPAMERDVEILARGALARDVILKRGRTVEVAVVNCGEQSVLVAADARLRGRLLPPGGLEALAQGLVGRAFVDQPVHRVALQEVSEDLTTGEAEARVTLSGVAQGPVDFEARDPKRITEPGTGSVLDNSEARVELRLLRLGVVQVEVFDAVTGERIAPRAFRRTVGLAARLPLAWTGNLLFVPDDERRHFLQFELAGYEPAEVAVPDALPAALRVDMQPASGAESGTFYVVLEPLLAEGRMALIGRDAEGRARWQRQLDSFDDEGRWVVDKVPVGEYAVTVLVTGMLPVTLPRVVVTRAVKETHRVRIEKGGGLEFKVTDADSQLLDKVHVLLKDAAGTPIDMHILTQVSGQRAFVSINYVPSAATARADSGLAPGVYSFTAYRDGYEPATREFAIRDTEVAELTITLNRR